MSAPGIGFGALIRATSVSAVDPLTLSPAVYYEQRGDVSDYSDTDTDGAGPDIAGTWEDRSGFARSFAQATVGDRPPLATAVDGKRPPIFAAANLDFLDATWTLDDIGDANNIALTLLCYVSGSSGSWGSPAASPGLLGDPSGWFRIIAGNDAGTFRIGVSAYTTTYITCHAPVPADTWVQVNVRLSSGRLTIAINTAPVHGVGADTDASKACGAVGAINVAMRLGRVGSTYFSGSIMSMLLKQSIADAEFTTVRTWWRAQQYPSIAGVLPA